MSTSLIVVRHFSAPPALNVCDLEGFIANAVLEIILLSSTFFNPRMDHDFIIRSNSAFWFCNFGNR